MIGRALRGAAALLCFCALGAAQRSGDLPEGEGTAQDPERPGRLILVSVAEPSDAGLRALLAGADATRIELQLAPADGEPDPAPVAGETTIRLRPGERAAADERGLEERLARASSIVLRGGNLLAWEAVFRPREHPTGVYRGLLQGMRAGCDVIGLGGGAAFLAGAALVERADLEAPPRNPRDTRPYVYALGLGLGPPALVELDPPAGEHALRVLRELCETRIQLAFLLEGEVALVLDYRTGQVEVAGPGRALVIDARGAREDRLHLREARLSLLQAGDVWELGHRRALPAAGAQTLGPDPTRRLDEVAPEPRQLDGLPGGLGPELGPLALGELHGLVLEGPFGRLELGVDLRTRRWRGPAGESVADLTLAWRAPQRR